ncbi:MAG: BMC domain-containing protein [Faecalimonas sp.]|nr:BMC domain-containing protein [Faecalimonas sp.]
MGTSYGFIEIPSTTAAIDALDIMCKAADVEFVTWEKKLGGRLVTIIVQGTISAVTAAVEAASEQAIKEPVAKTVIANPHEEIVRIINQSASRLK